MRTRTYIEVELTDPTPSFHVDLEMPAFSRTHAPDGFLGEEGMLRGREQLRRLFRLAQFIEQRKGELITAWREYDQLLREQRALFQVEDRSVAFLIQQWKQEAAQKNVQEQKQRNRQILQLRQRHSEYHENLYLLREEFFRHWFKVKLPEEGLRQQVLEYLRRMNFDAD